MEIQKSSSNRKVLTNANNISRNLKPENPCNDSILHLFIVLLLQWTILLVVTLVIFLLLLLAVGGGVALLLKSNLEEPDDRHEAGKFLINKFRGGCCRRLDFCVYTNSLLSLCLPAASRYQEWTGKLFFPGRGGEGQGQKSIGRGGEPPPLPTVRGGAGKGSKSAGRGTYCVY